MKKIIFFVLIAIIFNACKETIKPRPYAYYRISFPPHKYKSFISDTCPYTFEISEYATISRKNVRENNPCWFNIAYPQYKAYIHLTLRKVYKNLDSLMDDSYTLVYKHTVKAEAIDAKDFRNEQNNIFATVFYIKGNAASPMQFHITDTTNYFFRGSLYFEVAPNSDSLAPAIEFIEQDIIRLVESFEWKKSKCNACY